MSEFNYIEYLKKSKKMQTLNENFSIDDLEGTPGPRNSDGTPKSNGEMTPEELEDYYLNGDSIDDIDENVDRIREKVREALSEDDDDSKLVKDLLAKLEEGYEEEYNPDNDHYNMDSYSKEGYKETYGKEFDEDFPLEKMNEAKDEDEEDVKLEDEADVEIEDEVSNVGGDSKELTATLMKALEVAKSMGNEKLTTQVMNTLKFAIDQSMVI